MASGLIGPCEPIKDSSIFHSSRAGQDDSVSRLLDLVSRRVEGAAAAADPLINKRRESRRIGSLVWSTHRGKKEKKRERQEREKPFRICLRRSVCGGLCVIYRGRLRMPDPAACCVYHVRSAAKKHQHKEKGGLDGVRKYSGCLNNPPSCCLRPIDFDVNRSNSHQQESSILFPNSVSLGKWKMAA